MQSSLKKDGSYGGLEPKKKDPKKATDPIHKFHESTDWVGNDLFGKIYRVFWTLLKEEVSNHQALNVNRMA